jgi:hypothetical protein
LKERKEQQQATIAALNSEAYAAQKNLEFATRQAEKVK